MSNNVNPQAITFANTRIRPLNDLMLSLYWTAKHFIQAWNSQGMGTLIPFDSNAIQDGSPADGRPALLDSAAEQVYNQCSAYVNYCERGTLDTSGTQNFAVLNNIEGISVNGQPLF